MKVRLVAVVVALGASLISSGLLFSAEPEEKTVSVSARVVSDFGQGAGIHVKKEPGQFTVPEGQKATELKYSFHDPKTGFESTKLTDSSVYSVTEGKYVDVSGDGGSLALPPGKYRFVVGGGPGAAGTLSFKLSKENVSSGDKTRRKKYGKPNVICREVTMVSEDGTRQPAPDVTKDKPLGLSYGGGRMQGEHTFTQFLNGGLHRLQWTTTVDAKMNQGELSGTYEQFFTLTDFSDKSLKDGFMCNKRWLTGKLSGRPDKKGRVQVKVSDWTQKAMQREYGAKGHLDGSVTLYELKPWHEDSTPLPPFHLEFELQLPTKK